MAQRDGAVANALDKPEQPYGIHGDYFGASDNEDTEISWPRPRRRASMSIKIPPSQASADIAFTALQYLPMPVLVLASSKSIVLANEAMGRLLGIDVLDEQEGDDVGNEGLDTRQVKSATDILYGCTLSQLGLDLLSGGNAVFVAWEDFLETLVDDASRAQCSTTQLNTYHGRGLEQETTPTISSHNRSVSRSSVKASVTVGSKTEVHDSVVEVLFSTHRDSKTGLPLASRQDVSSHVQAQMLISTWATEEEQYFTLTFTASSTQGPPADNHKPTSRTVTRAPTSNTMNSGLSSASSSSSGHYRSSHTASTNPTSVPSHVTSPRLPLAMEFPPRGPPVKSSAAAPTMFSKTQRLKDAILNSMDIPAFALWKDESFGIPNKAAIKLVYPWIEGGVYDSPEQARDFLSNFRLYTEDFSEEIAQENFPIWRIMRERKSFTDVRVGMYSAKDGSRMLYDASGECLEDDNGEFLGGLSMFRDVTGFARTIDKQQKENESQFENICNMGES